LPASQKYLLCFDEWTCNHYHWLCDFLPRLVMAHNELAHYTLLLPDLPYIKTTGVKLLALFNLQPKSIVWLQPRQIVKVSNLTLISHAVLSGRIHDLLMQQLRERLRLHYPFEQVKPQRRVYISRANAAYRKVLNEDEVTKTVKAYGFEVVNFEHLTTEQQMQLANETAVLVSIHGAGLTNTLFMQQHTVVLEFKRSRIYYSQCYWHLSAALGLQYNYLFGQPDQEDVVLEGIGCNLTIPINTLRTALEQALTQAML
jgi:capsular polysaccharide biosynthesis protein